MLRTRFEQKGGAPRRHRITAVAASRVRLYSGCEERYYTCINRENKKSAVSRHGPWHVWRYTTMNSPFFEKPFRWNLAHEEQLGRLAANVEPKVLHAADHRELVQCCARVIAYAGNRRLIFVGRSPESLFDYLSGLLSGTSWSHRLALFHFSMRYIEEHELRQRYPHAMPAMREYMTALRLNPEGIATGRPPVAFVDLVYSGSTFINLMTLLRNWSFEDGFDWPLVNGRIRLIGITIRTKTSPKTWRWQQKNEKLQALSVKSVKNVSMDTGLWSYLGNDQKKLTESYPPRRWGDAALARPEHSQDRLEALALALHLYQSGKTSDGRREFAAALSRMPAMKERWFRQLVLELKQ